MTPERLAEIRIYYRHPKPGCDFSREEKTINELIDALIAERGRAEKAEAQCDRALKVIQEARKV